MRTILAAGLAAVLTLGVPAAATAAPARSVDRELVREVWTGARQVLGTTVVFGMLAATLLGVFLVPVFYVALENLARRWGKQRPAAEKAS